MLSQQFTWSPEQMININDILKDFPFIVLDGGLATELEKRGYVLNDSGSSGR